MEMNYQFAKLSVTPLSQEISGSMAPYSCFFNPKLESPKEYLKPLL
jgi:hypothetical protein